MVVLSHPRPDTGQREVGQSGLGKHGPVRAAQRRRQRLRQHLPGTESGSPASRCGRGRPILSITQENKTSPEHRVPRRAPPPSRLGRACASRALRAKRGRVGGGESGKEGRRLGDKEATPTHRRLCACSVRQLLVFSTRQRTPCSVRAWLLLVEVATFVSGAVAEIPSPLFAVQGGRPLAFLSVLSEVPVACKFSGGGADSREPQRAWQRKRGALRGAERGAAGSAAAPVSGGGGARRWRVGVPSSSSPPPLPAGLASGSSLPSPPPSCSVSEPRFREGSRKARGASSRRPRCPTT